MKGGVYKFVWTNIDAWEAAGWIDRGALERGGARLMEWGGDGEPVIPARGQRGADQNHKT
jgi:hypothetical protein